MSSLTHPLPETCGTAELASSLCPCCIPYTTPGYINYMGRFVRVAILMHGMLGSMPGHRSRALLLPCVEEESTATPPSEGSSIWTVILQIDGLFR